MPEFQWIQKEILLLCGANDDTALTRVLLKANIALGSDSFHIQRCQYVYWKHRIFHLS